MTEHLANLPRDTPLRRARWWLRDRWDDLRACYQRVRRSGGAGMKRQRKADEREASIGGDAP